MEILFTDKSKKQLSKIELRFRIKIMSELEKFEKGGIVDIKKLMGRKDEYRIRVGNYRIILNKILSNKYLVTKIGKKEKIYLILL